MSAKQDPREIIELACNAHSRICVTEGNPAGQRYKAWTTRHDGYPSLEIFWCNLTFTIVSIGLCSVFRVRSCTEVSVIESACDFWRQRQVEAGQRWRRNTRSSAKRTRSCSLIWGVEQRREYKDHEDRKHGRQHGDLFIG